MAEPNAAGSPPPPLEEALGWVGFRVDDMNGSRVGSVQAIYVDAKDGKPAWLIVKVGRFGKVTAIPFAECADAPGRIWAAHGRKSIRGAPAVQAGQPLTREDEIELCEHYRIHSDRGRHEAVRQRAEETVTAKPAGSAAEAD